MKLSKMYTQHIFVIKNQTFSLTITLFNKLDADGFGFSAGEQ